MVEAKRVLVLTAEGPDTSDAVVAGARLAAAVASLLAGDEDGLRALDEAVENADALGQGFIARLGRACTALSVRAGSTDDAAAVRSTCERIGDEWGAAFAGLVQGWSQVLAGSGSSAAAILDSTADALHDLGAGVLEAWARSLLALALAQRDAVGALEAARKAENLANSTAVDGARLIVYMALALAEPARRAQHAELARAAQLRTGLSVPLMQGQPDRATTTPIGALTIRCFGEFRVSVDGSPLRMGTMKPRTRALLRRLSADAGSAVHRDVLQETLWPGAGAESAARNLHVAISSLRQALEPGVARGASSLVVREGDAYRLVLPRGSEVDLLSLDQSLKQSRNACAAGTLAVAVDAFAAAVQIAQDQLLPEEGSADWIVLRRERCRTAVLAAAQQLATTLLPAQPSTAAQVCIAGLSVDRYDDALWRLLISARQQAGEKVAASRAEADYQLMLAELDVPPTAT